MFKQKECKRALLESLDFLGIKHRDDHYSYITIIDVSKTLRKVIKFYEILEWKVPTGMEQVTYHYYYYLHPRKFWIVKLSNRK